MFRCNPWLHGNVLHSIYMKDAEIAEQLPCHMAARPSDRAVGAGWSNGKPDSKFEEDMNG